MHTSSGSKEHDYPNLDLLRTFAVLLVYVYHLALTLDYEPIVNIGRAGVLLFFVHTSLVLMMSLERLAARGEPLFRSFYIRRLFRIYPLSILVVLVVVFAELPRAPWWHYEPATALTITANLGLFMNLFYVPPVVSVLWSLPYEVQMYAVLPVVFILGKLFRIRGIATLWLLAAIAGAIIPKIAGRLDIFAFGPCFLAGAFAYFSGYGARPVRFPSWLWIVAIALGCTVFYVGNFFGYEQTAGWAMCLAIGAVAPLCKEITLAPVRKLSALIARYSYGIYLTHLYAMWIAFVWIDEAHRWFGWIALLSLSLLLPVTLYHLVEGPLIRVGARLANRLPRFPNFEMVSQLALRAKALSDSVFGSASR